VCIASGTAVEEFGQILATWRPRLRAAAGHVIIGTKWPGSCVIWFVPTCSRTENDLLLLPAAIMIRLGALRPMHG
jgi:hypothetical protein